MLKDIFKEMFEGPTVNEAQESKKSFSKEESAKLATDQGYTGNAQEFAWGMDIELEHGTISPTTNVTDDDPTMTAKIALAHLNEIPDYYTRLRKLEEEGKAAMKSGPAEVGAEVPNSLPGKDLPGAPVEEKLVNYQCPCGYSARGDDKYDHKCPKCGEELENIDVDEERDPFTCRNCDKKGTIKIEVEPGMPFWLCPDCHNKRGHLPPKDEATHGEVPFDTFDKELKEDVDRYWIEQSDDSKWYKVMVASNTSWSKGIAPGYSMARFKTESEARAYIEKLKNAKNLSETMEEAIQESRMTTYTTKIASEIGQYVPELKRISIYTVADGTVGLYRYSDGNAYEIEIRPASLAKRKDVFGNLLKKREDRVALGEDTKE